MTKEPEREQFDPRAEVIVVLTHFEEGLRKAISRNNQGYTFEILMQKALNKEVYVVYNPGCCAIVQETFEPAGPCLFILFATGRLVFLFDLYHKASKLAKERGYKKVRLLGRKGFSRALKMHGWQEPYVFMEKEL